MEKGRKGSSQVTHDNDKYETDKYKTRLTSIRTSMQNHLMSYRPTSSSA